MSEAERQVAKGYLLGVDTGGTFTDFVLYRAGTMRIHKVLSTPQAPEEAILRGIAELGLASDGLVIVHGSTVATNAVLEGKGVHTLYIGNRGLQDILSIGRQARRELYNLQPGAPVEPVAASDCLQTGGRLDSRGGVIEPLSAEDLEELKRQIAQRRPEAVAINLLFSYLDHRFEREIEAAIPEGIFCSRSSAVLPASGEYERGVATWLNSWVGPLVAGYIERLCERLGGARLSVMQSSGEAIAAGQAARQAVRMLLSGPAGGLVGAGFVAAASQRRQLLTLDMGGTSTDVALIDGRPRLTREGHIGPWPVAVPMVDMHTIGAGGGSLAWVDPGGMLQVGPASAGADPGPACYGRGGREVTVTDANLILGRLRSSAFLGGRMQLDLAAAREAMGRLAGGLALSPERAAEGVIRVANEHMARALRVISVERGVDPRGFTLVSFGGAGGLHVCALADALGMRRALVPVNAGVLSALGMLATRPGRQLVHAHLGLLERMSDSELEQAFTRLARGGVDALLDEGLNEDQIEAEFAVDLRYLGQSYTLSVPWHGLSRAEEDFHRQHESRYGHRMQAPVELVNLRVALHGPEAAIELSHPPDARRTEACEHLNVWGVDSPVPCYERAQLVEGDVVSGPALITEMASTTWLAPGWRCRPDPAGNLLLDRPADTR
ncbi:MAG: hydantoinase/oxoprolinase family protein [Candidatus Thiodiazotropha sp. (ex Ctena orbiculata)]|uniref:Hydantoinase/oxoprolinase family protein n=1 Tax=Candidatus Thiodiazotropha taylori TaxID=2792791 RepID=A0A944M8G5_9GAMM|nr:hydantoinase/oxoprolinase family protein [Candidatus Thiodiazotropha taylori]MBV2135706.1 hydantoinase/oxoprolinase family protein [Candidatus Thiodiazotropha taylori]